jgi:SPP1 family predicted phage head-tail adaptor
MTAGTLRERITIQAQSTSGSQEWGPSLAWGDVATVWASVEAAESSEDFGQKGTATATSYTVRIRYRADVTPACRLVWRGRTLDIVGVIDVGGRRRECEIKAVSHG